MCVTTIKKKKELMDLKESTEQYIERGVKRKGKIMQFYYNLKK